MSKEVLLFTIKSRKSIRTISKKKRNNKKKVNLFLKINVKENLPLHLPEISKKSIGFFSNEKEKRDFFFLKKSHTNAICLCAFTLCDILT